MIIKVNYTVSDVYMSTSISPVYIKVVYSGTSGGGGTWGSITGTLSNQTDLQAALDAKFDDPTGTTAQYLRGDGTLATFPTIPSGTVTSVGLTMPVAFSVANSPITSSGTLEVTVIGTAAQYIRGDGQLATLPSNSSGGSAVAYYLNGSVAASVGTYYQMSKIAVLGAGTDFSKAGNGLISQFLTDVADPNRLEIPAGAWNFEMYFSASSSGGTPAFYVELLKYNGTTFTSIASSSAIPEAITSGTLIDLYLTSLAIPQTTLLSTDRLAIRVYIVNSTGGRTITMHTENSHLCEIITNFAGGVSALNGLTANTQYLATGTSGTNFAISSVGDTHTFNLPTASGTNRGALSSADWTTFNGKYTLPSLTSGSVLFSNGTTIAQDNANLFWDDTNNRLGIGTNTPLAPLHVKGDAQFIDNVNFVNLTIGSTSTRAAGMTWNNVESQFKFQTYNSTFPIAFDASETNFYISFVQKAKLFGSGNFALQNAGTFTDIPSAIFQANSTTQGILPPRMTTTQKNAIISPATGLQVYDTTLGSLNVYNGTSWIALGAGGGGMAIGGSITSATAGSVLFAGASGVLQQNNANFFWDDANNRLGIGTASPTRALDVASDILVNGMTVGKGNSNFIDNVALGFETLNSATGIGRQNVAIGYQSLKANTTGHYNVGIGYRALAATTTARGSIAIGFQALLVNTGDFNTGIGAISLQANTTGTQNIGIGYFTLRTNITGSNNVAIGANALQVNTNSANTGIGAENLNANSSGTGNTSIGYQGMNFTTTGSFNSAIGYQALWGNTTGSNNTSLGYRAGLYTSTGSVVNAITNNSIYIGYDTRAGASNQTNQIVIGYGTTGLGSNTTVIGNSSTTDAAIYGRLLVNYSAPVIGTYALDVNGTARIVSKLTLGAGTTSNAQINLASSTAPTSPNNGDIWFDGTDLKMRIGGVTKTFTLI
jgi:hypothetical protein